MEKTKGQKKKDKLLSDFDTGRTFFYNKQDNVISKKELYKNYVGLFIYIVVFAIGIPHILLRNKSYLIAALYFSNLDMIATVLGFSGGPYEIWQFLYNPAASSTFGFISSTIINYLALIGVGFVCIEYATRHNNLFRGLAMLLIILPITYLLPGNLIVYIMNNTATKLYNNNITYYIRWLCTLIAGFIVVIGIIGTERMVTILLSPSLEKVLKGIYKYYK